MGERRIRHRLWLHQLISLCICNTVIYASIGGLVGLMPLYLTRLEADTTVIGFFLALIYLSLALSNLVSGWLSARFQRRKAFLILGGLLAFPLAWLMSQATTVGPLLVWMACLWFVLGIPMTMAHILTGFSADAAYRGRSFGILSLSAGIGLFFGGLVSGPIVEWWDFPALFTMFAWLYLLIPLAGWLVEDGVIHTARVKGAVLIRSLLHNRTFCLLFVAAIVAQAANILIFLTRPFLMDALGHSPTTISTAAAVGGVVTLPLPFLFGWLTDQVGRKTILMVIFFGPTLGLLVQAVAGAGWHFAASAMLSTVMGSSIVVGSALITNLFSEEALSAALALVNATPWIGIVLGLSVGGVAIRSLLMMPALLLAVLVSFVAILLLVPIADPRPAERVEMS